MGWHKVKDARSYIRRQRMADLEQLLGERRHSWTVVGEAEGKQAIYGSVNGLGDENTLVAERHLDLDDTTEAVGAAVRLGELPQ